MHQNHYEELIGKTIPEAANFLKGHKIIKIQSVEYVCILKSYFFGLFKKRLFLYCTDDKVKDYYLITY